MNYYAIQVRTRAEERYIKLFRSIHPGYEELRLEFPRRRLSIRRKGKTGDELEPVFPGYIFLILSDTLPTPLFWALRKTDGFFRFLKSNNDIRPLDGDDLKVVLHFIGKGSGSIAEKSKVYFNDDDRIVVSEGPLKGLEGNIVKVDKRKGRAKIKLDLYDDSFTIDLAFEVIGRP
jgi:transcriptional antiterminator NusG